MQFRERRQKDFANNPKVFRLKSGKNERIFFFWSLVFVKNFHWAAQMQIWQLCRIFFYRSQKRFGPRSEYE